MIDATELIRRWLDGFNARDETALLAAAHPDIVLRPMRWVPRSEYLGREGVSAWFADIMASGNTATLTVDTVRVIATDRIVVEGTLGDDATRFVVLYEIREGLIAGIRAYLSDRELLVQLGLLTPEQVGQGEGGRSALPAHGRPA